MAIQKQQLGLECKAFWCEKLLRGEKDIELRQYPLPPEFLGKKMCKNVGSSLHLSMI